MTYELAKQLKDAGFPQTSDWGYRTYHDGNQGVLNYHRDVPSENDMRIPTLEELIEACGTNFGTLLKNAEGEWFAEGDDDQDKQQYTIAASTPAETVARLWLALHGATA